MNILSIHEENGCIIFKNKNEAQVVRLFFSQYGNESLEKGFKKKYKNLASVKHLVCINRLHVSADYRRKGWGSIIMNHLLTRFKESSYIVNAYPDDQDYMSLDELVKFYGNFGFKVAHITEEGFLLIKK